jgi:carbon storage regulator CsrA
MLVLSRRTKEKIVFPTLGITLEVCSVKGNNVRIGIDAPPSVPIVREELAKSTQYTSERHRLRNRLHTVSLAVHLAHRQLQAGLDEDAQETLDGALRDFTALDQELAAASGKAKREIRALLVEDNSNESALLAEFMRLHGVKVETACDGQDALDYLRSHDHPDVILLDMRMPRCDGPATLAAIRGNSAYDGTRVFAVSGTEPEELTLPTGSRGLDGWFTKPVNPLKLIDEMNHSLALN